MFISNKLFAMKLFAMKTVCALEKWWTYVNIKLVVIVYETYEHDSGFAKSFSLLLNEQ